MWGLLLESLMGAAISLSRGPLGRRAGGTFFYVWAGSYYSGRRSAWFDPLARYCFKARRTTCATSGESCARVWRWRPRAEPPVGPRVPRKVRTRAWLPLRTLDAYKQQGGQRGSGGRCGQSLGSQSSEPRSRQRSQIARMLKVAARHVVQGTERSRGCGPCNSQPVGGATYSA
jgi:hypothetical protein